jgi:O-antigen ligase
MVGLLAIKPQPEGIIEFDNERYFLPLNDILGIDGRWPGPFGHNGDTAMMGALIIVIAFAYWSRASWVFLLVGSFTLLLTNGRASMGAAAAGLIVIAMFVTTGPLARFRRSWRIGGGAVLLLLGAAVMYLRPAGLTGRERIWPAFLELWQTSPLLGVGGSGIAVSGGVTQEFGHAHSLYIDELARYGLVGFVVQFGALAVGVVIACWAAGRGRPGPLGVLVAYLVTAVTEPRNSWITPSATGFLVILMVVAAAAELRATERGAADAESTRRDDTVGSHP